jgi:hypothetical protein
MEAEGDLAIRDINDPQSKINDETKKRLNRLQTLRDMGLYVTLALLERDIALLADEQKKLEERKQAVDVRTDAGKKK